MRKHWSAIRLPNELIILPAISVHNRQRAIKVNLERLQRFAEQAFAISAKLSPRPLPPIDVVLISDRRMSELHRRFLRLAGPTDVITFEHGEIFISVETAHRQAREFGTSTMAEIELYFVHGLLHLCGFDDKTAAGARRMREMQDRIVRLARKT